MHVALDATPLLGRRTGVGQYVAHLVPALSAIPGAPDIRLTAFTWRQLRDVPALGGSRVTSRRVPARVLRQLWAVRNWPPAEWFSGRVDVFHATNFVLPPMRRAAGVLTVHDLGFILHADTVDATSRAYRDLVPRGLDRAGAVVTPSQAAADDLVRCYGYDRERVVVTSLGVDPAWSDACPADAGWLGARGLPERYLLFVGTREPRKNLPVLLAAHRILRAEQAGTPPLVLAGHAGWGDPVDDPGLQDGSVRLAGYLEGDGLRRLVARAACLVLPSRYEGFGLPPLEALACGTPVVVSDLPVLREVTGGLATYVPAGDAVALAAALADVVRDDGGPQERVRRRTWASAWTWERCALATLRAYELAASR